MTNKDLQEIIREPLVSNIGNRLTAEMIAGLMASIAENLMKHLIDNVADKTSGEDDGI